MLRALLATFLAMPLLAIAQSPSAELTPFVPSEPTDSKPALKAVYNGVNVDGKYIALTFDDGPHPINTPRLLDLLKQRGIKATFYVVGRMVREHPAIVKRTVEEGHEVANHSWSHPKLSSMSQAAVRDELKKTHDVIVAATGVAPRNFRPPYGAFTRSQQEWALKEFGYPSILWTVDPLDWKRPGPSVVARRILEGTRPGAIILAHDLHAQTVDAMPATIDGLLKEGYHFVTVTELLAMDKPRPAATPTPVAEKKPSPSKKSAPSSSSKASKASPRR